MKATVDHDLCTGCGICEDECPAVFAMKDGLATVICEVVPSDQEEDCQSARDNCPVEAIEMDD